MIFGAFFAIILLLFFFVAGFFVLAVFPVWMLIECFRSRILPQAIKLLWVVSIVMAWPFGSLAYASFASHKRSLARISNTVIILLIISSVVFSGGIFYFRSALLPQAVDRYQKMELSGATKEQQELIKADLVVLKNEMQANSFFSVKSLAALQLFELFQSLIIRSKVSPAEWGDWTHQVELRTSVQDKSIAEYMNLLREKTIQNILKTS